MKTLVLQKIKVYVQHSLSSKQVKEIVSQADIAGRLEHGNIFEDLRAGYDALVILDGALNTDKEISPSEMRVALELGVRIYGASHLGALLASAAKPYGAFPVGKIAQFVSESSHIQLSWLQPPLLEGAFDKSNRSYMDLFFGSLDCLQKGLLSPRERNDLLRFVRSLPMEKLTRNTLMAHFKSRRNILGTIKKLYVMKSQREKDSLTALRLLMAHKRTLGKKLRTYQNIQQAEDVSNKLFPSRSSFEADKKEWFSSSTKISPASLDKLLSHVSKSKKKQ
jgi:hypothetical protein